MNLLKKSLAITLMLSLVLSLLSCGGGLTATRTMQIWALPIFAENVNMEESSSQSAVEESKGAPSFSLSDIEANFATISGSLKIEITVFTKEEMIEKIGEDSKPDFILADVATLAELDKLLVLKDISHLLTAPEAAESSETEAAPDFSALPEMILLRGQIEGVQKAIPMLFSPYLMAFNKSIIEEAGLLAELPFDSRAWTFEEYTAFLEKLSKNLPSGKDSGFFYYASDSGSLGTKALVLNAYSADVIDNIASEAGVKGLAGVASLMQNNQFGAGEISLTQANAQNNFLVNAETKTYAETLLNYNSGNSAHILLYSFESDLARRQDETSSFETIFMPYPSDDSARLPYKAYFLSAISDESDEAFSTAQDQAMELILSNDVLQSALSIYSGTISVTSSNHDYLKGDYAYLPQTATILGEEVSETHAINDDAWIYLLKRVLFDGDDEAEMAALYKEGKILEPTA